MIKAQVLIYNPHCLLPYIKELYIYTVMYVYVCLRKQHHRPNSKLLCPHSFSVLFGPLLISCALVKTWRLDGLAWANAYSNSTRLGNSYQVICPKLDECVIESTGPVQHVFQDEMALCQWANRHYYANTFDHLMYPFLL